MSENVLMPKEPTPEMISLALSHLFGHPYREDAKPIGTFISGFTAAESEEYNIRYFGKERFLAAYEAIVKEATK
jgi:hypothetical protein